MRAADQIVDLGPGHGATGGEVVFQGKYADLLKCGKSLTGRYLSGEMRIEGSRERSVDLEAADQAKAPFGRADRRSTPESLALREVSKPFGGEVARRQSLKISRATKHNLHELEVEIPLGRLVCVTGVSGSGKTTLVREMLLPALMERIQAKVPIVKASERLLSNERGNPAGAGQGPIHSSNGDAEEASAPGQAAVEGWEQLENVVLVDQAILGKTPRSNPAVYIGAFDDIRELFAQSEAARRRGLNASAFSFNSGQGQCQRCRGAGFEKIEMQFLSDVYIRCPDCGGRRYREHILELKITPPSFIGDPAIDVPRAPEPCGKSWSIADILEATVEEAVQFLSLFPDSRQAQRAQANLRLLEEVGLGYLRLGQPINTLSGGESQRLKLVRHLAGSAAAEPAESLNPSPRPGAASKHGGTLFLFDEPTTGLHFDDVRQLLRIFQRLVDEGNSVVIIEHNLDVIRAADWIIDLGPDAGDQGGQVVAQGPPRAIMGATGSATGRALREAQKTMPERGAAANRKRTNKCREVPHV